MALYGKMSATHNTKYSKSYSHYLAGTHEISVVGRLVKGYHYLQQKGASAYALRIITQGYTIPFRASPPPKILRNNASSRGNEAFVRAEIDKLLDSGAVVETMLPATVVNPLSVATNNQKQRLVLDLRHVNPYIREFKCKLEGLDAFISTVNIRGHMITFDLKSGFHHVQINASQHQFLGFSYPDHHGRMRHFRFIVLPFGLASATLVFSKLLRQYIKIWRQQAIQCYIFIDDGIADHICRHTLS